VFIRHVLSEQDRELNYEREYGGSMRNVAMSVLLKKADVGATLSPVFEMEPEDIRAQLRTLVKSREIPSHPLCAHPRVPESVREAVSKAVLALAGTEAGEKLLMQVRIPEPTAADYDRDYKPLEGMEVKRLSNWGK
jgi:phosphonate transport system substrate-binding protein